MLSLVFIKMTDKLPKKFYRYQRLDGITIKSLCHDELYFSNPDAFNDPLECKPTIVSDSDNKTLFKLLDILIVERVIGETVASMKKVKISKEKIESHAQKTALEAARVEASNISYMATDPDLGLNREHAECHLLTSAIQRELLNQYDKGICCFSTKSKNPLLWSHYGDQHKGICIGYGLNRKPKPEISKVVYGGSRILTTSLLEEALLKKVPKSKISLDQLVLLQKASAWKYEHEWRLLGDRGSQVSSLELLDITFGLRCPDALKYTLIRALKPREKGVKFYQIREKTGTFKLDRSLVDSDRFENDLPVVAVSPHEIFDF